MKANTLLSGLVLCGGKSSRMGTDKGLMQKDGKSWAETAFQKLSALGIPVKLSINASQRNSYRTLFEKALLVEDQLELPGPLVGLLSGHLEQEPNDLLLLACDMTDISIMRIQQLIALYQEHADAYDFFVFKNGQDYEPMLGIYTSKGLRKIDRLVKEGALKRYSMKHVLDSGTTLTIEITDDQKKEFRNYNSAEDLE